MLAWTSKIASWDTEINTIHTHSEKQPDRQTRKSNVYYIATISIEASPLGCRRKAEQFCNCFPTSILIHCMPSERWVVFVNLIPWRSSQTEIKQGQMYSQHLYYHWNSNPAGFEPNSIQHLPVCSSHFAMLPLLKQKEAKIISPYPNYNIR